MEYTNKQFVSGVHNLVSDENIPKDSAQDSKNFLTRDGKVELARGRALLGSEGVSGAIKGLWYGYKTNGDKVLYRKTGTKIQYLNGTTWTDVITGLLATDDYSFANYSSLAGAFTFINGAGGFWKINNANPGSAMSMYDSTKNYHGKILVDSGRIILWDRNDADSKDKTGLYASKIDPQNSTVYNSVSNEVLGVAGSATYTGTLGFYSAGITRNCFGVTITGITASGLETFKDNFDGTLTSDKGGTGTINYITGAYSITFNATTVLHTITGTTISFTDNGANADYISDSDNGFVTAGFQRYETVSITGSTSNNITAQITLNPTAGEITFSTGLLTTESAGDTVTVASKVVASYQWENSNIGGITDFTKSATRLAGEGFQFPQDEGGDAILNVLIGQDGAYYSLKSQSAYRLYIDQSDSMGTETSNKVYRKDIGIPYWRACTSTSKGIVFMNTANPENPELTILQRNPLGDNIEPYALLTHFDFTAYDYSWCCIDTFDRYILIACSKGGTYNDTLLLCDLTNKTVDIIGYEANVFAKDSGNLYIGSPLTESVYQIFNGFDDDGYAVNNYWISRGEKYAMERLKKTKRLRFKGLISPQQSVEVYASYDDDGFSLVGTIYGGAEYVDYTNPQTVGNNMVGEVEVGGGELSEACPYFMELKLKSPKFRKRTIKVKATGIGYFDFDFLEDFDILLFDNRLPKRHRQKQNVSLDGTLTDQ